MAFFFYYCHRGVSQEQRQPNFVLINIDDLGYGEIQPFGSVENVTPNLTILAEEGTVLTSFYSASSVCSPSRAALLTGCYPQRVGLGLGGNNNVVLFPADSLGLNGDETTLAEQLKMAGYITACIGKWHLGDQPEFLPLNHGFDYYYGIPYSNDMWPRLRSFKCPPLPLLRGCEVIDTIDTDEKQALLCDRFTNEAISFIGRNKDQPFFLYLPHSFIHNPWFSQACFAQNTQNSNREKGGTIAEVDYSVGRIMNTLKTLGLDENTLVWFISDNGGVGPTANLPLKGGKGTYWEGGFRVPGIVRWPGKIPANTRNSQLISALDIFPTLARLAGIPVSDLPIMDGMDMTDFLTGQTKISPREVFYYYWRDELAAIRYKNWKMLFDGRLFDLKEDVNESTDVSGQHPEIVNAMQKYFEKARKDLGDRRLSLKGQNCRSVGRKRSHLKFLIPGTDENGWLSDYWVIERIKN